MWRGRADRLTDRQPLAENALYVKLLILCLDSKDTTRMLVFPADVHYSCREAPAGKFSTTTEALRKVVPGRRSLRPPQPRAKLQQVALCFSPPSTP